DDDYLDVETVFHAGRQFADQHRQSTVADEGDDLPLRTSDCGGDSVRQPAGHRGEVSGAREHHAAADVEMPRCPGGDSTGIGGDDGVVAQQLVQLVGDDLRLHRLVVARAALLHQR